jgi:nucleotide-binding universal stress UspA family protein
VFAHDTFVALFGAVRPGELDVLPGLVRAALREGYAIVLNEPGTKKPLCTLTAAARKQADREAQDEAAERGEPNAASRRHPCGIAHALTEADATKVTSLLARVTKTYGAPPNIGLEPGASRLIAVDMDTVDQRDAFLSVWEREDPGAAPGADVLYTVRSPGQKAPDGSWAHSEGGHTWFTLPAGERLPTTHDAGRGVLTDDGGWSLIWSGLQVLVPPSARAEGPYACVGMPRPAPAWLLQRIEAEVLLREERERLRLERRAEREQTGDTDLVDTWSADTTWAELLEQRGWSATGRVDTCSCPTWTAPGPHGSPKSATAHDEGCAVFDTADGHAPMHVWTDNPPDYLVAAVRDGHRTLTKLTHEAYADHDGDESAAVIGLGLAVSDGGPMVVDNPFDLDELQATSGVSEQDDDPPWTTAESSTTSPQAVHSDVVPHAPRLSGLMAYDSSELDDLPDPDPLIFGLLDRGSVAILSGKFGTYKSFLALDWACHVALGLPWAGHDVDQPVPVVYIAAEGQVGVKRRVRGWRRRHLAGEHLPRGALTVIPQRVVLELDKAGKATAHLKDLVALVTELGAGLVVFDTLSKSKGKADENSNSEMSAIMALVIELTKATKATVLLVAHTGYSGEHTRGGSAQEDDVDTVFVVKFEDPKSEDRGPDNRRVLHHRKSKDGDLAAPMILNPRVEELGEDSHGRTVTTLTLTTDPFLPTAPATGPRGAITEPIAVAWFEDQEPPPGMTRRALMAWVGERGLKARAAVIWDAYKNYQENGSVEAEPDDQGNHDLTSNNKWFPIRNHSGTGQ